MSLPWKTKAKKTAPPDPIPPSVRDAVHKRAGGKCELCRENRGVQRHHRQLRRGGDHSASNVVLLCALCHLRIHGHVDWSIANGWLVSQYGEPALAPLVLSDQRVVLLHWAGHYEDVA